MIVLSLFYLHFGKLSSVCVERYEDLIPQLVRKVRPQTLRGARLRLQGFVAGPLWLVDLANGVHQRLGGGLCSCRNIGYMSIPIGLANLQNLRGMSYLEHILCSY